MDYERYMSSTFYQGAGGREEYANKLHIHSVKQQLGLKTQYRQEDGVCTLTRQRRQTNYTPSHSKALTHNSSQHTEPYD